MAKIGGRLDYTGKTFTMSFYWGIRTTAADSYVSISARNGGTDVSDKYIVCTNDEVFCIYAENSQGTFYLGENVPDNLVGSNTGYSTVTGKIVCKNGDNITANTLCLCIYKECFVNYNLGCLTLVSLLVIPASCLD